MMSLSVHISATLSGTRQHDIPAAEVKVANAVGGSYAKLLEKQAMLGRQRV